MLLHYDKKEVLMLSLREVNWLLDSGCWNNVEFRMYNVEFRMKNLFAAGKCKIKIQKSKIKSQKRLVSRI